MSQCKNWLHSEPIQSSSDILTKIPSDLAGLLNLVDKKTFVSTDVLSVAVLPVLSALTCGTKLFREEADSDGERVLFYVAAFFRSGGGKTSAASILKFSFLGWLEKHYQQKNKDNYELKEKLVREIEREKDIKQKSKLEQKLADISEEIDVFLPKATEEGLIESLKNGSRPFMMLDNIGKEIASSRKNDRTASLLRMLDEIFDAAVLTTKRTVKGGRSQTFEISAFGLYAASTLGDTGLSMKMIQNGLEDGFLNRFLVVFQPEITKDIPYEKYLTSEEKSFIEEFAKRYFIYSSQIHLVLSDDAKEELKKYNAAISKEFRVRYALSDHSSGFISRNITMVLRIAMVFHISKYCTNISLDKLSEVLDKKFDAKNRELVKLSAEIFLQAKKFFEYIKTEHTLKLLGISKMHEHDSKTEKVLNAITRKAKENRVGAVLIRDITTSSHVTQKDGLKEILEGLITIGKIYKKGKFYHLVK